MTEDREQLASSILLRLNIHFAVLSILAAFLVGMGMQSSNLPVLVILVSISALIVTDYYGLVTINRTWSYLGMLGGAAIALYHYWFDRQSNAYYGISNLHAVASMLVYIQLPLMFQRKDQRLFEHWGVFLLLEFIVAALLNDNVLFGVILIPSLVVGCSTLVTLANYVTHELAGKSGPETSGFFATFLDFFRPSRRSRSDNDQIRMSSSTKGDQSLANGLKFGSLSGLVLANGIFLFAIVYFFGLPRLHTGAFEGLGYSKPVVGFSGSVSLDDVGELMLSDDLALRMSIKESRSRHPFMPTEPPYIRGTVLDVYEGRGNWHTSNESMRFLDIPIQNQVRDELTADIGTHIVTIQEQARLGAAQFSLPPFFRSTDSSRLKFSPSTWCLRDTAFEQRQFQTKQRYQFVTSAFMFGRQDLFLADTQDCLLNGNPESFSNVSSISKRSTWSRQFDPKRFPGLLRLRDEILASVPSASSIEKALALEDFLATSSDFTYSLLPKVDRENGIDPIEDFAANHRTGHCQYFASTLAIMLRSIDLPSRIVVGFRPAEYNDLGNYFVVRQRHAHAWVEVHLGPENLREGTLSVPSWASTGIWLRLDPTPQAEGSNAGGSFRNASQSGQTLEAIEQLWKDSFMDFDSSRQPESVGIFGASGDGAIAAILRSFERLALQMQSRTIGGDGLSIEDWFSWRSGIMASCLAVAGLIAARFLRRIRWPFLGINDLPSTFDPKRYHRPTWLLFRRMMVALGRVGLHRRPHQTPLEFVETSQTWLGERGLVLPSESASLRSLVDVIYAIRFGPGGELSPEECKSYEETVRMLENFSKQKPEQGRGSL